MLLEKAFLFARVDSRFAPQHRNHLRVEPHLQPNGLKFVAGLFENPLGVLDFFQTFHHLFFAVRFQIVHRAFHVGADVANGLRALLDHRADFLRLGFVVFDF